MPSPAISPIEQASKFTLVINQKTANALGIVVPPTLLAVARQGGLFQAPHVDARWTRITNHDNEFGADNSPDRILACSGSWALVEKGGVRGWWRHLCSNQVTNWS